MESQIAAESPRPPRRASGVVLGVIVALGLATFVAGLGGFVWVVREMRAEAAGQGFGVSPEARIAYQQAQQIKPDMHLLLSGYYPPGSMVYANAVLSTKYDPERHVKLEVRGVTLVIENGLFEYRYGRPYVLHQGSDPTTGYQVKFRIGDRR